MSAYDSVLRGDADWLLVGYNDPTNPGDDVAVYAYGPGGLPELKRRMLQDPDRILIAFIREDAPNHPGALLVNYIPPNTSPSHRARALVHSRRLGAMLQAHQTTLTVDSLSVLTTTAIARALAAPDETHVIELGQPEPTSSYDNITPPPMSAQKQIDPMRRSFSTQRSRSPSPPYPPRSPSPVRKRSASMFSSLLSKRRSKRHGRRSEELPPPTPPKDKGTPPARANSVAPLQYYPAHAAERYSPPVEQYFAPMQTSPSPPPSLPPKARESTDRLSYSSDEVIVDHPMRTPTMLELPRESTAIPSTSFVPPQRSSSLANRVASPPPVAHRVVPLPEKWSSVVVAPDPAERARRRIEAQRQRDREAAEALRLEEEHQQRIKAEREARRREELEEEARRRASIENEIRRATSERRRREQLEREEEERRAREIAERKRLARLRRQEEHRRLEQWRAQQAQAAEEAKRQEAQARRSHDMERKRKIEQAEAKVKTAAASDALVTGWVTLQTPEYPLAWRRRYYKVIGDTVFLYRNPKDMAQHLDQVELRGKLRALKEWNEGYEELESIPHSFAIEFTDERGPWSAFADNEEEKYKLLGLLHHAAGL